MTGKFVITANQLKNWRLKRSTAHSSSRDSRISVVVLTSTVNNDSNQINIFFFFFARVTVIFHCTCAAAAQRHATWQKADRRDNQT